MSSTANYIQTYFLSINILPQQSGVSLRKLILDIDDRFENCAVNVQVLHKFKVSGEARIVAVVDVTEIIALEKFIENVWDLGSVDITSNPMLHYETFTRNLGAAEELVTVPNPTLVKDHLYWLEIDIEYHGKTTETFLNLWKREAEFVLSSRARGESTLIPYKSLGQRKVHVFINHPSLELLDKMTLELPIVIENGANMQMRAKGIQFLEEYTKERQLARSIY